MSSYAILGVHGHDCRTVAANVARVRFFVDDRVVDEDVPLPLPELHSNDYNENPLAKKMLEKACQDRLVALANSPAANAAQG